MHPHHVLCSNPVSVSEERVEGVGMGGETRRVGGVDSLQGTPFTRTDGCGHTLPHLHAKGVPVPRDQGEWSGGRNSYRL